MVALDETYGLFLDRPRRREAAGGHSISRFFRRLFPFPFAGLPVVAGNTAQPAIGPINWRSASEEALSLGLQWRPYRDDKGGGVRSTGRRIKSPLSRGGELALACA